MAIMSDESPERRTHGSRLQRTHQRFFKRASWIFLTALMLLAEWTVELVGGSFAFFGSIAFIFFLGLPLLCLSFVTVPLALLVLAVSGLGFAWQLIKAMAHDGWLWLRAEGERTMESFLRQPPISRFRGRREHTGTQHEILQRTSNREPTLHPRPYHRSNRKSRSGSQVGWIPIERPVSPQLTRGPCRVLHA